MVRLLGSRMAGRLGVMLPFLLVACGASPSGPGGTGGAGGSGGSGGGGTGGMMGPVDTDGDTIADEDEGAGDTDGDGTPDLEDLDSDGDGISDADEAGDGILTTPPIDSDGDGVPNFKDLDSDNDGTPDLAASKDDTDGDGVPNFADVDDDGDFLPDADELVADCNGDGNPDAPPADCDGDGLNNSVDSDSDNDTIPDDQESSSDTDGDNIADYLDTDSDNDTIPDAAEAGDDVLATPPVDTDGDLAPDYVDPDSDDDGVSDQQESTIGSDPLSSDSDADGTNDLVELAAGTDLTDSTDNPQANGDFVFVVPFDQPTLPMVDTLEFRTNIQYADVYLSFDDSGSMSAELAALQASLPQVIADLSCDVISMGCSIDSDCAADEICFNGACVVDPAIGAGCIPDLWTGVGKWTNLNTFKNLVSLQPNAQVTASAIPPVGGLPAEAPFQPGACVADPANCPNNATMQCTAGGVGCPAFRSDAVRIYVQISDADQQCSGAECATFTAANTGAALKAKGISFVGLYNSCFGVDPPANCNPNNVSTDEGGMGTAFTVMSDLALATGTFNAISGDLFIYSAADALVTQQLKKAVLDIAKGKPLYATIADADDPNDSVDATQFIDYLEVNVSGGACTPVAPTTDLDNDGKKDAFPSLQPGKQVCWDLHPVAKNTTVMPTDAPQLYRATLTVSGDGSPLDSRDVYFLIPPKKIEIMPPN